MGIHGLLEPLFAPKTPYLQHFISTNHLSYPSTHFHLYNYSQSTPIASTSDPPQSLSASQIPFLLLLLYSTSLSSLQPPSPQMLGSQIRHFISSCYCHREEGDVERQGGVAGREGGG
ncbi:hypothetical protein E2C01_099149 [Portunus trituberculatus]|uniref:Uncharacterized protein n=1 Tax=Portunus trituberculatus TaxID=210409 RepID=A0A5B7KE53_PORTR|nr:hypothetical protein [Portunus trituberculatus]